MQRQDSSDKIETLEKTEQTPEDTSSASIQGSNEQVPPASQDDASRPTTGSRQRGDFDWLAVSVALGVASFFALTARLNSQPSPSFLPAAIFSATGCGLLVTALRKVRGRAGVGLREAALAGFGMALLQFVITFTYPDIFTIVTTLLEPGRDFLITWGLIALFATVLSLAGAALGHLAFAPPRPLPARPTKRPRKEEQEHAEDDDAPPATTDESLERASAQPTSATQKVEETTHEGADEDETGRFEETAHEDAREDEDEQDDPRPQHTLANYAVPVLLLGLLPMMAGYVFAACYDFIMNALNVNTISPALFPTLSLLSGLLPWRLAAPINLAIPNGPFIVFTLLWRVPDGAIGNPNLFDVQALEPLLFNATALAFLLLTGRGNGEHTSKDQVAPTGLFLLLEACLGLILVLPSNLWLLRGLEAVLQIHNVLVIPLRTIYLLTPTLFTLNLVTGMLFCLLVGLILKRQYQLWTEPGKHEKEELVE